MIEPEREQRELGLEIAVELREIGEDEVEEDAEEQEREPQEHGRIDHRRADPAFRLVDDLGVLDVLADRIGEVAALLAGHEGGGVDLGKLVLERGERLGQGLAVPDVGFDLDQDLLEAGILDPVGDDLDAPQDGIPGPDQGHELLVEHDEIAVLDFIVEGQGGQPLLAAVPFDREDAQSFGLELAAAVGRGRGQPGVEEDPSVVRGQMTDVVWHLYRDISGSGPGR